LSQSSPSGNPYRAIAALYDLEHDAHREDLDLIHTIVETVGDPVLELGCGSGRVLASLGDLEMRLTGVDNSAEMLERSRERLKDTSNVTLIESTMDATGLPDNSFGVVLIALNTLMHAGTADEQRSVLREAFRVLDPRGQLYIDLPNPHGGAFDFVDHQVAMEGSWQSAADGSAVSKFSSRTVSRAEQRIKTDIWYDIAEPDSTIQRIATRFELRYLYPSELLLLLELAGFIECQAYGTYELDPLTDSSPRLIVTAEKTASHQSQ
jgi:ubiquinone/menaquinone biosynthesis C-methylase UbiE